MADPLGKFNGKFVFLSVGNCVFDHMKFFGSAGDWETRCISQGGQ